MASNAHEVAVFDCSSVFPEQQDYPQWLKVRSISDGDDLLVPVSPAAIVIALDGSSMDVVETQLPAVYDVLQYLQATYEDPATAGAFSAIYRLFIVAITETEAVPDGVKDLKKILRPMCDFMKFTVMFFSKDAAPEMLKEIATEKLLSELSPAAQASRAVEAQMFRQAKALRDRDMAEREGHPTALHLRRILHTQVRPSILNAAETERQQNTKSCQLSRRQRRCEAMQHLSDLLGKVSSPVSVDHDTISAARGTRLRASLAVSTEDGSPLSREAVNQPRDTSIHVTVLPSTEEAFIVEAQHVLQGVANVPFCPHGGSDHVSSVAVLRGELRDGVTRENIEELNQDFKKYFPDQENVAFRVVEEQNGSHYDAYGQTVAKKQRRFLEVVAAKFRPDPINEALYDLAESVLPELGDARANASHDILRNLSVSYRVGGTLSSALGKSESLLHTLGNGGSIHAEATLPLSHRELVFRQAILSLCDSVTDGRRGAKNPFMASVLGDLVQLVDVDVVVSNPTAVIAAGLSETFDAARFVMSKSPGGERLEGFAEKYHSTALEEAVARTVSMDFLLANGAQMKSFGLQSLVANCFCSDRCGSPRFMAGKLALRLAPLILRLSSARHITNYYSTTVTLESGGEVPSEHIPLSPADARTQVKVMALAHALSPEGSDLLARRELKEKMRASLEGVYVLPASCHSSLITPETEMLQNFPSGFSFSRLEKAAARGALCQNVAQRRSVPLVLVLASTFSLLSDFLRAASQDAAVIPYNVPNDDYDDDDGESKDAAEGNNATHLTVFDAARTSKVEFIGFSLPHNEEDGEATGDCFWGPILGMADAVICVFSGSAATAPIREVLRIQPAKNERWGDAVCRRQLISVFVHSRWAEQVHAGDDPLPTGDQYCATTHTWDGNSRAKVAEILAVALRSLPGMGEGNCVWDGF